MKRHFLSLVIILLSTFSTLSALDASVTYARFYPSTGAYVEVYLNIIKSELTIGDGTNGVEVLITFTKDDNIEVFNKYILKVPRSKADDPADLIDLQRFGLKPGSYTLDVEMVDVNDASKTLKYSNTIDIADPAESMMSDIQLAANVTVSKTEDKLSKNGYRIEPLLDNFMSRYQSVLPFYVEIYNADSKIKEDFMVQYSIVTREDDKNKTPKVILEKYKRLKPEPIIPLILKLDLEQLKSGNYDLVVQIKNRDKVLIDTRSARIYRSNPNAAYMVTEENKGGIDESFVQLIKDEDLDYYLKSINPIVSADLRERLKNVEGSKDVTAKRIFLDKYWFDAYGASAAVAFEKYSEVAKVVDNSFNSGFGYGFETDRGYMYLKYGQPDDVVSVEDEPSAPPYEIWIYNNIPLFNQTNVKFLFYNPSLSTNGFILLHSTCRGERRNPAWEVELYRDATSEQGGVTVDTENVADNLNRNARRYFNDF